MPDESKNTSEFLERLRHYSDHELQERLSYVHEAMFNLRFRMSSGQVEDPKRLRKYKKAIARIRTIQTERQLGLKR
jgi:large subunit ribosomal protein L29